MADAAKATKVMKEPVSPIPGLDLAKPAVLLADFKRFRHDDLFFVSHCTFYPPNEKPIPRVVALSPQAIVICSLNGVEADRVAGVNRLSGVILETLQRTKFGPAL